MDTTRRLPARLLPFLLPLVALLLLAFPISGQDTAGMKPDKDLWAKVDRLASEQKYEAARKVVEVLRTTARAAGDEDTWVRALVREVQLRMGLHGYETAVRFLRQQEWPATAHRRTVLELFYAHSLLNYFHMYSWEIRQRERVDTGEELDLKAWTRDRIVEEIRRTYVETWNRRGEWGDRSLGSFAEYFDENDYPPRIRGTLRDAVSYLWVALLADTSLWSPKQSNEVFLLDRAALIRGSETPVDFGDAELHPLLLMAAVLDDLEAWHRLHDRPEAAFEARLERLRRLGASLTEDDDRKLILRDLEQHLDALGRRYEWWSMGKATLAEWVRGGDDPGALIEARRIALAGAEAHPGSAGGRRCRHLVAAVEQPRYRLEGMAADGLARRSLRVTHANLSHLYFRAYPIDLEGTVKGARDANLLPGHREVEEIVRTRTPVAEWTETLPATVDYRDHPTYVTPPMGLPGAYLVVASARSDFREDDNQMVAANLILGDLVLLSRTEDGLLEVTARSGATGRRLPETEITLYRFDWKGGHRSLGTRTTGESGAVTFDLRSGERYFLVGRRGKDLALDHQVPTSYQGSPTRERASLVYTDRSIYRPRQKVFWKTVTYRIGKEHGDFEVMPGATVQIDLLDPNLEVVASTTAETNDFGSAAGELEIPGGRLLGLWQVRATYDGVAQIRVEEYKRPTFEVSLDDPEGDLRLNRPATLGGEVRYYFGLPVAAGDVSWRVTRQPVFPPWWWWFGRGLTDPGRAQTVASGRGRLDAEGRFELTFTPAADERLAGDKDVSYRYAVSVDVTDEGGETRSASRSFRLGFVAVDARIESEARFFRAGDDVRLTVHRSDLDGLPRAGSGAWRLVALDQPAETLTPADQPLGPASSQEPSRRAPPAGDDASFRTPGDDLRPRWDPRYSPEAVLRLWNDGPEKDRGEIEHGDDGRGVLDLGRLPGGAYRLHYSTRDAFGAERRVQQELVVVGEGRARLALPGILRVERPSVAVGETARLLVHSGLDGQELELRLFRGGRHVEKRILDPVRGGVRVIEIPIGKEHRGGLGVSLVGVRDHQLIELRDQIVVPWDDRRLALELATFRDRLRPGDRETWKVVVRGADEKTVQAGTAELLAYMYDRSLDLFAPHNPEDPLARYPTLTAVGPQQSTLRPAWIVWRGGRSFGRLPGFRSFHGDRLKVLAGYGIGGPGRHRLAMAGVAVPEARRMTMAAAAPVGDELQKRAVLAESEVLAEPEAPPPPPPPEEEPAAEVRSDFSETAFWEPQLRTADDGSVEIEFTVPDSVTEWKIWIHALTRDLRAGSLESETRTVKELLVRPYLPRFLREGDRADLRVVVNNSGEEELAGRLAFEIFDPETEESLLDDFELPADRANVPFRVEAGAGTTLVFPVRVPPRVGTVAFKAVARAGVPHAAEPLRHDLSDGELRPLPVLPGRVHLLQSRFAALRDADRRVLTFADLAADGDPTRIDEQLVVTLDAQLFYGVLGALPYLVSYPYECIEQTLNRFVSTGILTGLYDDYPAVARMAEEFSRRDTRFETWDDADPNRKMALEETPWLQMARGGKEDDEDLIRVLDPRIAAAQRDASLAELEKAQTSLGAFPWWPGGPPSPYMTLYLLQGFSRALEFGIDVPQDMVVRAWQYLHRHYVDEIVRKMVEDECCWEMVTFMSYVLSSYPDPSWTGGVFSEDDREKMLAFSFAHWRRQHSPLLKSYLALTLERAGRPEDAALVFDSVMDSARTEPDLGTYWAPEDRAWLWYNDTIETHAFALRTLTELDPDDARRHGLVHWLFLNKKLNHWKSTRATAEVIYSLVHYLQQEGALGVREDATVTVGPIQKTFLFEPDVYMGKKNQVVIPGADLDPSSMSSVTVEKSSKGLMFASATWHFSTERMPEGASGDFFSVTRRFFRRLLRGEEWVLEPLEEGTVLAPGDQVEVQLSLRARHAAEYVHLRDPRGAGFEPETVTSSFKWDLGLGYYEEIRDSGTNFFFEWLPAGEYTFKYRLRANLDGTFAVGPATLQSMYAPEFAAYSSGARLTVGTEKP